MSRNELEEQIGYCDNLGYVHREAATPTERARTAYRIGDERLFLDGIANRPRKVWGASVAIRVLPPGKSDQRSYADAAANYCRTDRIGSRPSLPFAVLSRSRLFDMIDYDGLSVAVRDDGMAESLDESGEEMPDAKNSRE